MSRIPEIYQKPLRLPFRSVGAPFEIDGHEIVVGASVGIALAPDDGMDPSQLLKSADLALYRAKAEGTISAPDTRR